MSNLMIAGIVLYNPELKRLEENVNAILPQVDILLLVDNGSYNIQQIKERYQSIQGVRIIQLGSNKGIAAAQNRICELTRNEGYEWVITLDQDSVAPQGLVVEYEKMIADSNVAMVCPRIIDRNFGEIEDGKKHEGIEEVLTCIASASAIRISAWEEVGGFFEPLFIDKVDFDMCYSLHEHGYKILQTNNVNLLHEVGHGQLEFFAGKQRLILNHSPLRYYYIMRNGFIVGRRHHMLWKHLRANIRLVYQINRYESGRWEKNIMLLKGFLDGLIGKEGKYGE